MIRFFPLSFSISVANVVHIPGDGEEPDKIKFKRLEKFSIQGLYEQILESPCIIKLFPNVPKIQLEVDFFEGLIFGTINIVFKSGSHNGQPGTIVTEYFEIITPSFFASFIQDNTRATHKLFLHKAQKYFQDKDS